MKGEKNKKESHKKDKKLISRIILIGSLILLGILLTSCAGIKRTYPNQETKARMEEAILYGP